MPSLSRCARMPRGVKVSLAVYKWMLMSTPYPLLTRTSSLRLRQTLKTIIILVNLSITLRKFLHDGQGPLLIMMSTLGVFLLPELEDSGLLLLDGSSFTQDYGHKFAYLFSTWLAKLVPSGTPWTLSLPSCLASHPTSTSTYTVNNNTSILSVRVAGSALNFARSSSRTLPTRPSATHLSFYFPAYHHSHPFSNSIAFLDFLSECIDRSDIVLPPAEAQWRTHAVPHQARAVWFIIMRCGGCLTGLGGRGIRTRRRCWRVVRWSQSQRVRAQRWNHQLRS